MAFTKGKSGNPGGRPRGMQRLVREMLGAKGFRAVVRTQFEIATGTFQSDSKLGLQAKEVTAAATWLRDTAGFKPPSSVDVTSQGGAIGNTTVVVPVDPDSMTDEQLEKMQRDLEVAIAAVEDGGERAVEDDELGGEGELDVPEARSFAPEGEADDGDESDDELSHRGGRRGPSN